MSIEVMGKVWRSDAVKGADRMLLLAIADHCDDDGLAWPGITRLAEKCNVGENAARATVRRLEADGWLTVSVGGGTLNGIHGRPNRYQINVGKLDETARKRTPPPTGGLPIPTPPSTVSYPPVDDRPTPPSTGGEPSLEPSHEPSGGQPALIPAPPVAPKARTRAHTIPDGFRPTDAHRALALSLGVDLSVEGPQFVDHHTAKGSKFVQWDSALNTWIRNAAKYAARDNVVAFPHQPGDAPLPPRPKSDLYG